MSTELGPEMFQFKLDSTGLLVSQGATNKLRYVPSKGLA
jgi:hypothetical protein